MRQAPSAWGVTHALVFAIACLAATPVGAQRPHGVPPGLLKRGGAPAPGSESTPAPAGGAVATTTAVRSFGVWLDDASVLDPRVSWLTVSVQRWASPALHGFDVPVIDLSVGIVPRLQVSASVPFTQYALPGSPMNGQLGDLYLTGKYVIREPAEGRVGVSVAPSLEVLSTAATADTALSRMNGVLATSVEWRIDGSRVYGSTGYYTRGAVFAGAALERAVSARLRATGALTFSRSTAPIEASTTWGLAHQRVDLAGSVSWIVSPRLVVFGGLGRTLSHLDPDSTRYAASFGTSMELKGTGPSRPPVRP
jgi:hypothetical protein